ncbi:hypothetical protein HY407_04585 [Candidatus Gottesmanbacteria bacterium]|nr:hypothetical protein [Candidatus Gottesmanbacteria bacterium]
MSSDLSSIIIWWLTIFIIGAAILPLTRKIFSHFIDQGYIFTKVLGIFFLSYIVWILGTVKMLPFLRETILLVLLVLGGLNLWLYFREKKSSQGGSASGGKKSYLPKQINLTFFIVEEVLFLLTLVFWSYIKGMEPSIHGLEKFMDFGFVESIGRSSFFPPLDMWLTQSPDYTGHFINYYYFGHFITALLTKLSGVNSAITYNLAIATLFAFTFTLSFSLGINLVYIFLKSLLHKLPAINYKLILVGGFLAAFIVSLGGNLHTIYAFTQGYPNETPAPFWQLPIGFHPESYWYPNATRFIPYTIHEFPLYSFVVADLHGHVSDIPFVLLTLALLLNLLIKKHFEVDKMGDATGGPPTSAHLRHNKSGALVGGEERQDPFWKNTRWFQNFLLEFQSRTSVSLPYLVLLGILLAVMYMTNAVDGLIYLSLAGLVFLYRNWTKTKNIRKTFFQTFSASLFLLFFFLIGSLPFSLFFKPFGTGVGVLCAPLELIGKQFGPILFEEGKCQKSEWWMLTLLWGFFYYNVIGFLVLVIIPRLKQKLTTHNLPALPAGRQLTTPDIFVILTTIISTLLLIFPEFFYIKDIYPAHYRANTMFKLGYQAFMMLGINSAYIFVRIRNSQIGLKKSIYYLLFTILFFLIAIYPFFAINSYYGGLKTYHGLDGLSWMKQQYPEDYEGIIWLRKNISGQPVILEANGDSYTDYARVSANTGLPTVIGWPVHEWLWRGSYDEAGKRIPEVQLLYESKDLNQTKELLDKYNISYIFIGTLERQKYPNLNESKWNNLGRIVFQKGLTKIIQLPP